MIASGVVSKSSNYSYSLHWITTTMCRDHAISCQHISLYFYKGTPLNSPFCFSTVLFKTLYYMLTQVNKLNHENNVPWSCAHINNDNNVRLSSAHINHNDNILWSCAHIKYNNNVPRSCTHKSHTSKPEQPGPSCSIRLKVVCTRT